MLNKTVFMSIPAASVIVYGAHYCQAKREAFAAVCLPREDANFDSFLDAVAQFLTAARNEVSDRPLNSGRIRHDTAELLALASTKPKF